MAAHNLDREYDQIRRVKEELASIKDSTLLSGLSITTERPLSVDSVKGKKASKQPFDREAYSSFIMKQF